MPNKEASTKPLTQARLVRQMAAHAAELREQFANNEHSESLAQAVACAAPILAAQRENVDQPLQWLSDQLSRWERTALTQAQELSTQYAVHSTLYPAHRHLVSPRATPTFHPNSNASPALPLSPSPSPLPSPAHLYELVLHHLSPGTRKRRGVYFTPEPIANYIVHRLDVLLRERFALSSGLTTQFAICSLQPKICNPQSAIHTPQSAIPVFLDPACGTGVFLLALIDRARRQIAPDRWNAFVPDLLSRLVGIEILPAAAFLTKLNLTLELAQTGFDFQTPCALQIHTADALSSEAQSKIQNLKAKIPIILGNPPFSSLSTATNPWITNLVRGNDEIRGYVRANGQRLRERKTWLHDDYVKFIRLAQWHIENAGCGLVGYVTNHGYLDNVTFRLMRQELLRVFPHIEILDLHGNRKKQEVAPGGQRDENVFHLDQGLAISLFCKPPTRMRRASVGETPPAIQYSDLWGTRNAKLSRLASPSPALPLSPSAPNYVFIPQRAAAAIPEYTTAWSLGDAMPINTTAPVTARDHFVVAFTREELQHRISEFGDLTIPDEVIRRRYFHRTRSARYQAGDTRGWRLSEARKIVAADDHWADKIIRCLYRPFDWRYVFWHPAMIDWPRTDVTRHLLSLAPSPQPLAPLCLIARRQQLPGHPCTFFWISNGLALDGVIRSDNRGSESLFPLYVHKVAGTLRVPSANFAQLFIDQFAAAIQLAWQPQGGGDFATCFGPEDLLAYIYALFHAPTYRERYADELRTGFPRVIPPRDGTLFRALAGFGQELIGLHLLHEKAVTAEYSVPGTQYSVRQKSPSNDNTRRIPDIAIHSFRAGGYEVLKKWLQPKHRSMTDPDYPRIVAAIARTLEIISAIENELKTPRNS